ncbi:MAG: AAA family ATPase [Clostridia bacterium]|nr:AAA family ATPase [Clostridia bacterium]
MEKATYTNNKEMDALLATLLKAERVRTRIVRNIVGQDYAADKIKTTIMESYATKSQTQRGPKALILAIGTPGTGKSESAMLAAEELGLPCYNIDCNRYGEREGHNPDGTHKSYKEAAEGEITGPIKRVPVGVLILNEFDMAHSSVKNRFQPLFETGFLHDKYHGEEIDFRNVIVIVTTNAGSALYDSIYRYNYATLPESKILSALRADIDEDTKNARFSAATLSRFAKGTIIPFNKLNGQDLCAIALLKAELLRKEWKKRYPALKIDYAKKPFARSLLFQKGGQADARNMGAAVEHFFAEHLENAATLVYEQGEDIRALKKIAFRFEFAKDKEIRKYFRSGERYRVAAYGSAWEIDALKGCGLFEVLPIAEGERISSVYYDAVFVSVDKAQRKNGLQIVREAQKDEEVPVYAFSLTERKTAVDKKLYNKEGVSGFYNADEEKSFTAWLREIAQSIELVKATTALARESRVIEFDVGYALQRTERGITAVVTLRNYRKEKVVNAIDERELCAAREIPDVRFSDVKGAAETLGEIKELIEGVRDPIAYKRRGMDLPKGVLLYGASGTGKTYMAKAIANETRSAFIHKNATEFESMWVGKGAENIRSCFAIARKYTAVLFIDEIDAFGKIRGRGEGGGAEADDKLQNAFLSEMDGFREDDKRPAFVIAATNFSPEKLDKAFLRRFDRVIEVKLPKATERLEILQYYMDKYEIGLGAEEIGALAERTVGRSPADLAKLVKFVKQKRKSVSPVMKDFEEGLERLWYGERQEWSAETMRKTAYHECGHCLTHYLTGGIPAYVTNISRGGHGGYMQFASEEDKLDYSYDELLDKICVCFGGRAAERIVYGEKGLNTGASADLAQAREYAKRIVDDYGMEESLLTGADEARSEKLKQAFDERVNEILVEQYRRATAMIVEHRALLERLAERLFRVNGMNKKELERFFKEAVLPRKGGME